MMMKNDICGIYLITNKINGHMYVGQSTNIHKRWRQHCALYDLDSSLVEKAIAKYGEENFSFDIIITLENDTEKLNDAEREWIAILNTYEDKNHYNQTPGGDFNPAKVPEIASKISEAKKGKKYSEETRKKMSEAHKGQKLSEEARKKISKAHKGKKKSKEHRKKLSEAQTGKKHSEKTRKKMSEAKKGKKRSEDAKKKISEAKNTTGYYRVGKKKAHTYRQGFAYYYRYYDDDGKQHLIQSISLEKLEQKVKDKGLLWFKFEDNNDNIFKIQKSNKVLYDVTNAKSTGQLYNNSKSLDLDMHQILKTKHRVVDRDITIEEAKQIATDIGISYEVLQEVAYNLTTGVFDKYIAEWQARLANTL